MIDPHEEERLRKFARDSVNLQILFAEIDRLREALDIAAKTGPHGLGCRSVGLSGEPCDCWKSEAVNHQRGCGKKF